MTPPAPTTPPEQLGYSTPPAPAAESSVLDAWPITFVLTTFATLVTATMVIVVPHAQAFFRDYKMELTGVTRVLFALARAGNGLVWPAVWILPFLPVTILALRGPTHDLPARRRTLRVWRVLATLATLAFVAAVALALLSNYIHLIDSISGNSGHGR